MVVAIEFHEKAAGLGVPDCAVHRFPHDAVDVSLGFRRQCDLDPTPLRPDAQISVRPEGRLAGDGAGDRGQVTGPGRPPR
ncbi:hypothetical protein, partial [Streptomyces phaeochromogenes]